MHLVRTRPFSLARDFDTFFGSTGFGSTGFGSPGRAESSWAPRVDVYEADGTLHIRFELAGFTADDLELTLDDGVLTVRGSRAFEVADGAEFHRKELARGSFARSLRVGDAYDSEQVAAEFSNGLLEVTLQKRPEVLPRTIEIETA